MILLLGTIITLVILTVVTLALLGAGGALFVILAGDFIVFVLGIVFIIKSVFKKK